MTKKQLIIATRESPLALWQANWVKKRLEAFHPHLSVHLLGMTTTADSMLDISLSEVGGKGLFVKELEEALLDGRADIAVHSMKDVPMDLPQGLVLPVMCEREDPRDAFVSNKYDTLEQLHPNARVGTSSLRRQSQLHALRPDLQTLNLRGNVNTRLQRLDRDDYDAIILAAAGLKRLGFADRIKDYLSTEQSLPAAGQGVLGIECREGDEDVKGLIAGLNHEESALCVTAERAMCRRIGGGCQAPVAAYAEIQHGKIRLRGLVASEDGIIVLRTTQQGSIYEAEVIGENAANDLLQQGAAEVLKSCVKKK